MFTVLVCYADELVSNNYLGTLLGHKVPIRPNLHRLLVHTAVNQVQGDGNDEAQASHADGIKFFWFQVCRVMPFMLFNLSYGAICARVLKRPFNRLQSSRQVRFAAKNSHEARHCLSSYSGSLVSRRITVDS